MNLLAIDLAPPACLRRDAPLRPFDPLRALPALPRNSDCTLFIIPCFLLSLPPISYKWRASPLYRHVTSLAPTRNPFKLEAYAILITNAQTARTGDSVRKLAIVGAVIALISLLFGRSLMTPEDKPFASQVREDTTEMVDLSGPREGAVNPERALYEGSLNAEDPELVRSHPTSRRGKDEEFAYQEAVDSFSDYYRDTINETNPLVHLLVMQSRGEGRMTEAEAEDLNAHLLELEEAPEFGAVESYPKGYEDCSRHLGAGAVSLDLAADSIRGFNESTDADYLKDYQALIGMYLQAVADAKSCVSDHLYPAYP